MNLQQAIFTKLFKDNKERTVLAYTPFGDILFKENDESYFALQIYADNGKYGKDNPFHFTVYNVGSNLDEFNNFVKQGDFFKEPHLPKVYEKIFSRKGLYEELAETRRKSNYDVYISDKEKCKNSVENTQIIRFNKFCELVLEYGKFD